MYCGVPAIKPELVSRDGQECPESLLAGRRFAFIGGEMTLAGSQYKFHQHGQSGQQISELLPHLATVADERPEASSETAKMMLAAPPSSGARV